MTTTNTTPTPVLVFRLHREEDRYGFAANVTYRVHVYRSGDFRCTLDGGNTWQTAHAVANAARAGFALAGGLAWSDVPMEIVNDPRDAARFAAQDEEDGDDSIDDSIDDA